MKIYLHKYHHEQSFKEPLEYGLHLFPNDLGSLRKGIEHDLYSVKQNGDINFKIKLFTLLWINDIDFLFEENIIELKTLDYYSQVISDKSYYELVALVGKRRAISYLTQMKDLATLREKSIYIDIEYYSFFMTREQKYAYKEGVKYLFSSRKEYLRKTEIRKLFIKLSSIEYCSLNKSIELKFSGEYLQRMPMNVFIGKNGTGKSFTIHNIIEQYLSGNFDICFDSAFDSVNQVVVISNTIYDSYPSNLKSFSKYSENLDYKYYSPVRGKSFSPQIGVTNVKLNKIIQRIFDRDKELDTIFKYRQSFEKFLKKAINCDEIGYFGSNGQYINQNVKRIPEHFCVKKLVLIKRGKEILLSSGQISFLTIISYIIANVENNSLVFIDEIENFLHPNYIIDALSLLKNILLEFNSVAVLATHSLFVVREMYAENVFLFQKDKQDEEIFFSNPDIETYSADLQNLSQYIFFSEESMFRIQLNNIAKNYHDFDKLYQDFHGKIDNSILMSIANRIK